MITIILITLFSSPVPDLSRYVNLAANYNLRELTRPEDVLAAFAGITTALSQIFYGGFICGLPNLFFDIALCWRPLGPCQRRMPSCQSSANEAGLPSCSWAGWKALPYWVWQYGCDYIKSSQSVSRGPPSSVRIFSTVQWYCQQWVTDKLGSIRGPKEMQALRTLAEDGHNLPAGWARLEYIDDSLERYGFGRSTLTTPR